MDLGKRRRDWPVDLAAADLNGLVPAGSTFPYYDYAIQAVAVGLGLAIGIRPYIDCDLAAGRLVRLFDAIAPRGQSWRLAYQPRWLEEPWFQAFRDLYFGQSGPLSAA